MALLPVLGSHPNTFLVVLELMKIGFNRFWNDANQIFQSKALLINGIYSATKQ